MYVYVYQLSIHYELTYLVQERLDRIGQRGSNAMLSVTYLKWFGSHRTLPVGLIAKHCAKITDYINESKYEPTWKFKFRIKLLNMIRNCVNGDIWRLLPDLNSPEHARLQIRRQHLPPNNNKTRESIWIFLLSLLQCSTRNQVGRNLESSERGTLYAPSLCFWVIAQQHVVSLK